MDDTKKCAKCHTPKTKDHFTSNEWKRPYDETTCIECAGHATDNEDPSTFYNQKVSLPQIPNTITNGVGAEHSIISESEAKNIALQDIGIKEITHIILVTHEQFENAFLPGAKDYETPGDCKVYVVIQNGNFQGRHGKQFAHQVLELDASNGDTLGTIVSNDLTIAIHKLQITNGCIN